MKLNDETMQYILALQEMASFQNMTSLQYSSMNAKLASLTSWLEDTKTAVNNTFENTIGIACLIFNANPCTLGHRYLIELASKRNKGVVVFVIQGKTSSGSKGNHENTGIEIPFELRLGDVQECAKAFHNVLVLPGGPYIISRDDFPSQWSTEKWSTEKKGRSHSYAILNAKLLCQVILPELGIKTFYVGDEPRDEMEEMHLNEIRLQCKNNNINLKVAERKRIRDKYISSSMVREFIACNDWKAIKETVPPHVYERLSQERHLQ